MRLLQAVNGYLLFKATRCTPETIKIDRTQVEQFVAWYGDRDVLDLTTTDVVKYLRHSDERGLSAFTKRRQLSIISALYRWLGEVDVAA